MYPTDRRMQILQLVNERQLVSINELCDIFETSKSTIRRDLQHLEQKSLLETSYGCAKATKISAIDPSFLSRSNIHLQEKSSIAELALDLIQEGECILLDGGTTVTELAKKLPTLNKQITVVCTAINIASLLEHNHHLTVVLTGGILRDTSRSLIGDLAKDALEQLHISKAFIGAGGVTKETGLTNYHLLEAEVKKKIIAISNQVIVLADHSKFGIRATVAFASLNEIDTIITDDGISDHFVSEFASLGINLLTAQSAEIATRA